MPDASTRCITPAARSGDLTVDDIVASLRAAEHDGEVADCAAAVVYAGLAFKVVAADGSTLSRLVADTRRRLRVERDRRHAAQIVAAHGYGGDVELAYLDTFPRA